MKNLYIKFKEWDQESLNKAIRTAESLWATKCKTRDAIKFKWTWVLCVNEDKEYYTTSWTIETLERALNYTEYKPEPKFKRWEKVLVKYNNDWIEAIYLATIEWAIRPYIVVAERCKTMYNNWEEFEIEAVSIIKKIETIKIKTEDWQTISISRDKAEELWFNIN